MAKYGKFVVLQPLERFTLLVVKTPTNMAARNIRDIRAGLNITQKEASERCGMDIRTYQRAEEDNPTSPPGIKVLRQISSGFNVNIGTILGDERPTIIEKEHDIKECLKRVNKAALRENQTPKESDPKKEKRRDLPFDKDNPKHLIDAIMFIYLDEKKERRFYAQRILEGALGTLNEGDPTPKFADKFEADCYFLGLLRDSEIHVLRFMIDHLNRRGRKQNTPEQVAKINEEMKKLGLT